MFECFRVPWFVFDRNSKVELALVINYLCLMFPCATLKVYRSDIIWKCSESYLNVEIIFTKITEMLFIIK